MHEMKGQNPSPEFANDMAQREGWERVLTCQKHRWLSELEYVARYRPSGAKATAVIGPLWPWIVWGEGTEQECGRSITWQHKKPERPTEMSRQVGFKDTPSQLL